MIGRLAGRSVVVVGAGTEPSGQPDDPVGNGRAISVLCGREGASVVCVDKVADAAEETAALVRREGSDATGKVADVRDPEACRRLVDDAANGSGLDGVVLNVGIGRGRGLEHTSTDDWDATFAVNVRAHFLVAQAALPRLDEGGAIVFVSSVAALRPGTFLPSYDASKAGVLALCRHVALEGARRGIRANAVVPGLIDTPMGRRATQGRPSRGRTRVPLGREGTAWEVARACVFLLSDEASYITGQHLAVDGGLSTLA